MLAEMAAIVPRPSEIDADDAIPILVGEIEQGTIDVQASVVHEDVHTTEVGDRLGDCRTYLIGSRYIHLVRFHASTEHSYHPRRFLGTLGREIMDRDVSAFFGEAAGDRPADSRPASRD
jgi:hypothetical protein